MTLTTNWQNVASYTFNPGTGFRAVFYLDAKYSTQSQANNTTTVQTRLNCDVQSGSGGGNGYRFTLSYASTREGSSYWGFEDETIMTGESTITHNTDGTKSINLSASMRVNYTGLDASMSATVDLPRIDRFPILSSAQDFNDEANPKITFSKTLGFTSPTVQAGIYNSAGTTAYLTRTIPNDTVKNNGEYTFQLTDAERNTLRNAMPNAKTMQVQFKLKTTVGSTVYDGGTITKTLSIVNANPTLTSPTYSEQNAKVSSLLGTSGSTVVQNASTLRVGITATAKKGASISKVVATHSGSTYTDTSSPYSFDIPIKSNSITLTATDSRTNTGTYSITRTMLAYTPVAINTFSFKRQDETSSNIILNLTATYYQQTFGSTANAPIVKWKLDNGSWTTLTSSQYTIDNTNHKLTVSNLTLSNALPYTSQGTFYIYIEDKLTTAQNSAVVSIGIPTMEMGKDDVIVHGSFKADTTIVATNGFKSRDTGQVGTATSDSNGMLLIKRANNSEAPNNGVVLEYGNSASWRGQLYIGDNATQGIYYNGWSSGTRGTWKKLATEGEIEKYSTSETKIGTWVDGKTLYRKVFTGSSIATISSGLTTVDNVIRLEMLVRESGSSKGWRNIPWLYNSTDTNWMGGFFFRADNGNIGFQIGNSLKNIDRYIIIMEYTKTTN